MSGVIMLHRLSALRCEYYIHTVKLRLDSDLRRALPAPQGARAHGYVPPAQSGAAELIFGTGQEAHIVAKVKAKRGRAGYVFFKDK